MLTRHFIYPHDLEKDEVIRRMTAVLSRSPNAGRFLNPDMGLVAAVWRWCLEYDFNPAWWLVSLERERGLLRTLSTNPHDWLYALGYVGQDGAGTVNPRWNGLIPQSWLCIHQTAWIAGFGQPSNYGVLDNLHPHAARWNANNPEPIQLYSSPNVKDKTVVPTSLSQHVILSYTPHAQAEDVADNILKRDLPEFL